MWNISLLFISVFALWGCQPISGTTQMQASVVSVGKTHLILQDGDSVMFLAMNGEAKARVNSLKKGDAITLVGKAVEGDERSLDIVEIITADGTRIPLGG